MADTQKDSTDTTEMDDYQDFVHSCPQPDGKKQPDPQFMKGWWAAGQCFNEAGEVFELFEKSYRKDIDLDLGKLEDELGDVIWGIACICNTFGMSIDNVIMNNISKLRERHFNNGENT